MESIGDDITNMRSFEKSFVRNHRLTLELKPKILEVLSKSEIPLNLTDISNLVNGKWLTVKQALIDLEIEGKIKHFRSGKYLLFVIESKSQQLPSTAKEV